MIQQIDYQQLVENTYSDLKKLDLSNFFITGGTGYIGKWILEVILLANRELGLNIQATVLTRNPIIFKNKYPHLVNSKIITLIAGDVRNYNYSKNKKYSHMILAATDVINPKKPLETFEVTINGTRNMLDFAFKCGVNNVLLLSSGAVYGQTFNNQESISEKHPTLIDVTSTNSAYGIGKITSEWLGNLYGDTNNINFKSARIFAQIGPYLELNAHFAVGNLIRDALFNNQLIIKGDGTTVRSYMYSTDLVTWLIAILVRGKKCAAYNVGSNEGISIYRLAQKIINVSNTKNKVIEVQGKKLNSAASDIYIPDISLAQKELGLTLNINLNEAIIRTMNWHLNI